VSSSGGAGDDRRILHCDMDCFYAAVHMRDDPELRGRPVVIGGDPRGRGVVAAASYEARGFGVRSAMPSAQALRLCPDAVFLRPDFPRYRSESDEVFEILHRFTPIVQPVSIDEAYLDVSEQWPQYGSATAVAQEIRRSVREERRLTVSIGVAPNRLVAKIASDFDKPDGLTVVPPKRVADFLAPLPVRVLQGVGPATAKVLRHEVGVETIEQLRQIPMARLVQRLGRYGETLHRYARGIDARPVSTHRERKSLSAERTYGTDLHDLDRMDLELERLGEEVARGLARRGIAGATVTVKVRYPDFVTVTRSRTLRRPVDDARLLTELSRELLRRTEAGERGVRLLGLGVSKLARDPREDPQLRLFAPFTESPGRF
jgi:DNA polymerase-4